VTTADYPVGPTPFTVFQRGQNQPRYGLTNTGSDTIYVSNTTQTSPTDGWPLNPSATMPWPAGTQLSIVCPTSSTLQTLDADVGLFDPSAIASEISGIGVPAIDQPALLLSLTTAAVPSGSAPADTTAVDCRRYQGVYISGQEAGATNLTTTRVYTLVWYADASLGANTVLAREQFSVATYGGAFQVQRPVRGAFLVIQRSAVVTTTPDTLILSVYGTMRNVSNRTYLTSQKNNATTLLVAPTAPLEGIINFAGTITGVGASKTEWPNALMGCQATIAFRTTATLSDILAFDLQSMDGSSYFAAALTNTQTSFTVNAYLPAIPLSLLVINFSTGTPDFQLSIMSQLQ